MSNTWTFRTCHRGLDGGRPRLGLFGRGLHGLDLAALGLPGLGLPVPWSN
jgi:hypothetical protein